jgi:hypothetical protein
MVKIYAKTPTGRKFRKLKTYYGESNDAAFVAAFIMVDPFLRCLAAIAL